MTQGSCPKERKMWKARVQCDIIRWFFVEELRKYAYTENYYVLATNGKTTYIHTHEFADDYDLAAKLVEKINKTEGFSPEGKSMWVEIIDIKEHRPKARDWKRKLVYGY